MKRVLKTIAAIGFLAGVTTGSFVIGAGVAVLLVVLILVLVYVIWRRLRRRRQHAAS